MYQVKEKTPKITLISDPKIANHATITQNNSREKTIKSGFFEYVTTREVVTNSKKLGGNMGGNWLNIVEDFDHNPHTPSHLFNNIGHHIKVVFGTKKPCQISTLTR